MQQFFRLSPQQERVWLLQDHDSPPPYRAQCSMALEGRLDQAKLSGAIEAVVNRHEILRTTFHKLDDVAIPVQIISDAPSFTLLEHDLTNLDTAEQEPRLSALLQESRSLTPNFSQGPLLDCVLVKLSTERSVLALSLPALCTDARGLQNLAHEIRAAYRHEGQVNGEQPMQYADYAAWRHELLTSEETKAGREFWQQVKLPPPDKSPDKLFFAPRSPTFERFDCHTVAGVPVKQLLHIEKLARRYHCDASTFLLACYHVLLWRLNNQAELVVATLFDGRKYDELKSAIGLFAIHLPVVSRLNKNHTFIDVLAQLRESVEAANLWQEYFDWSQLAANGNGAHHFPFAFEYSASSLDEHALIDRWKLKLTCKAAGDTLQTTFSYDAAALSADDVSRISERFNTLLASVVANVEVRIGELEILPEAERQQVVYEFNNTGVGEFSTQCLHELVAAQAQRTPDAPAVLTEFKTVTYRELNERANQLAHYLQELGVRADQPVGIFLERSVAMVVGLLGILKAGGAYVPLDPDYPAERISFIVADAAVSIIVTTSDLRDRLPGQANVLCLDSDWTTIAARSTAEIPGNVTPDNLAYVIYTSGTTGRPKGVMITHRAINNRLLWMQREFPLVPADRLLQKTVYTFDASVWELFVPLIAGAQLVMAIPGGHQDSAYLVAAVAAHKITVLQLVPSMLKVVLEEPGLARLGTLKRMFCGGELLPLELQKKFFDHGAAELINLYGPTEVSIDATAWLCERHGSRSYVTIGHPLANVQVLVLDEFLKPTPIGVAGELYVGGVGLARGYWQRPALTAQRFVPHPFASRAGARLYRTGDLARYHADGTLEYLGRIDHQVKLRGYRIELGEIETCLAEHAGVRETIVTLREDANGNQILVAYVIPRELIKLDGENDGAIELSPASLREHLAARLPHYLVPSAFVLLERMPLLPNGKVDRQALPAPEEITPASENDYVAPRTPVEEVIAAIWSELLGVARVGINDNFFELGGHSLLATQIVSRLRDALHVELPLRKLFASPTVADLATIVAEAQKIGAGLTLLPPIEPAGRTAELPLSFAQERLWFLHQLEPQSSAYHLFNGLRLRGPLNVSALERTLQEIVQRHEVLRTTFQLVDGRPVQRIAEQTSVSLESEDLSALADAKRAAEVERIAHEVARRPFDLAVGPLVRAKLLRLGDDEHVLLFTLHHIISDGWSATVLVREVAALYEAFCAGLPSPLPQLNIQYADYAVWQRRWLQGEVLESHRGYWQQQLKDAPPLLDIPTDRPRPVVQTFNGAAVPFSLSPDLSEALAALSRSEGATSYMTLLAAFQILMARYSGQSDIVVGGDTANRTSMETESLIGFFVNMLVMRTNIDGELTFPQLLQRVRDVALNAYAHQELPFEKLVEELQVKRELSRNPLFQVLFTLQNNTRDYLELGELQLEPIAVSGRPAKFDLTLAMKETNAGLMGVLEYNTDLFEESTIQRMAGHFETLLASIVANVEEKVSLLSMLTDEEQRLLREWSDGPSRDLPVECAYELFEAQAARTPAALALHAGDVSLTYAELNKRANQLANLLRSWGVGPDVLVALCMNRSAEMVIAILGVMKAGGAYVPLEPGDPFERLSIILEATKSPLVLTTADLVERLPSVFAQVLCLDTEWDQAATESDDNLTRAATADNLAYVIHTSGSTGTPKGVMVTQRGLVNYLGWCIEAYRVTDGCGSPVHSPLTFDLTVTSLLSPLCAGRAVTLIRDEAGSAGLVDSLRSESGYSLVKLTPAHLVLVGHSLSNGAAASWSKTLVVGGEALNSEMLTAWREHSPATRIVNEYGPTETVVGCCVYEAAATDTGRGARVPIGRPIANTQLHVLDVAMQPAAAGLAGELYVGGFGLARGYLNSPALTAERFVPDPFSAVPGARLYRTGDLVRYLADGNLDFLGRQDHQIKLRGYRIELGEIESILAAHRAVREVVVTMREDTPGDRRLVAYLVLQDERSRSASELHDYAQQRLPEYMVPSAFVMLEALPLNANGKIDRAALPAPDGERPQWEGEYVPPRTPLEEVLAGIWAELLSLDRVGVHDNFFALGGHSLLATQLLARLLTLFKLELPLIAVFRSPTIAEFAGEVVAHESKPGQVDKIAATIRKIQQMPASEKSALVNARRAAS